MFTAIAVANVSTAIPLYLRQLSCEIKFCLDQTFNTIARGITEC